MYRWEIMHWICIYWKILVLLAQRIVDVRMLQHTVCPPYIVLFNTRPDFALNSWIMPCPSKTWNQSGYTRLIFLLNPVCIIQRVLSQIHPDTTGLLDERLINLAPAISTPIVLIVLRCSVNYVRKVLRSQSCSHEAEQPRRRSIIKTIPSEAPFADETAIPQIDSNIS